MTSGDSINASQSQGFIQNPTGPVTEIIVNGNLVTGALGQLTQAPSAGQIAAADDTLTLYRQQFVEALHRLTPPIKYDFPLACELIAADGTPLEADSSITIDQLIDRMQSARLNLLRGSAGSGKSTAMRRLAALLTQDTQKRVVPIYLQIRQLSKGTDERLSQAVKDESDPEQYIDPLLTASIVPLNMDELKRLGERAFSVNGGLLLVIADGLNEIYGEEIASSILQRLTTYVTKRGMQACVLVTDRNTPRDGITQQWQLMRMRRLTPEVVQAQFHDKGIDTIYAALDDTDHSLLQTPYFLEYALEHNATRLSSPTQAIASFFDTLDLGDDALDQLAAAAFAVYKDHHSYQFDLAHFANVIGQDSLGRLLDDGVVLSMPAEVQSARSDDPPTGDQAQFDHPLKHDYLAAKYLAQHEDEWTPPALDALSFEANSFDALSMTLELLPSEEIADRFIERVHNWNWAAALACIAKAMRFDSGRHSEEMLMAVLALVAEKLFDPVQQTRERASGVLALFPTDIAAPYKQAADIKALCKLVQDQVLAESKFKDGESWFPKWRDLFICFDGRPFDEQALRKLVDSMAVIGWTAANVFKRTKLNNLDVRQLRAYYDACYACDPNDWQASTVRWRVVHALGVTDTQPVVDLLFLALKQDHYPWARIGAARSLVELAALTTNDDLRRMVLNTLMELVKQADSATLGAKTLREIGQSAFYSGAHAGWEAAATPLIELVQKIQPRVPEQEWWSTLLEQFKAFCQEQAPAEKTV